MRLQGKQTPPLSASSVENLIRALSTSLIYSLFDLPSSPELNSFLVLVSLIG
jgi:hypothetical protein